MDVCTLQDGIKLADDLLAQVMELVFTAESCVQQGFYGVPFRQDDSCNTYLELEDRVSLWGREVCYCLRLPAVVSAVHLSSDQCPFQPLAALHLPPQLHTAPSSWVPPDF